MSGTELQIFTLLDGATIPWLGWGNGSGKTKLHPIECGQMALDSGVRHIDTAQLYRTERATAEAIEKSTLTRKNVYITSKLSGLGSNLREPVPLDEVEGLVEETVAKLGTIPDLFLIHNPFIARVGELKGMWKILEDLKTRGKLKSIGVSNFRPQDLELILEDAVYKPVVNQIEYHPYTLAHLQPVLDLQAKHGIITQSFGPLTPTIRHPTGGPLKPILSRIAERISKVSGKNLDSNAVLLLWIRAQGVVAITTSSNAHRIKALVEITCLPDLLMPEEIEEITRVGKTIHYRHYSWHMETDFPVPNLPSGKENYY